MGELSVALDAVRAAVNRLAQSNNDNAAGVTARRMAALRIARGTEWAPRQFADNHAKTLTDVAGAVVNLQDQVDQFVTRVTAAVAVLEETAHDQARRFDTERVGG